VGAHLTQDLMYGLAQITFHPAISVQDEDGYWRDRCNLQLQIPVPPPAEFMVMEFGIQQGNLVAPTDQFTYHFIWAFHYRFFIHGHPWEDFHTQISLSRSAILGPLENHNFRKI